MNNTKTFRLFISSTFSDFKKERQTLQLKVFPEIKKYCIDKGYKFQPIDLRWGVSNEAQLDQKTLELCLNEVRACKSHPHPNFLVMIGDRYGWVPLPYMIEKVEFENLSNTMNDEEKRLVLEWYREDLNQIPSSYILQSRSNEFVDCDLWQEVENKLRIILQNAVKVVNLSEEQSRKYYLSATEAEVEEGIIPYHSYTEYQKQLISDDPSINEIDPVYIFGFLRDSETISLNVLDNEYANTQQFKNRVKDVLPSSNIFHKQIHNIADEFYLIEFEERVIAFLKAQIDSYEDNTQSDDLQQEIEAQAYFAQQKRKNFLAQETVLEAIASYIASTNNEPLIIYGPSGRGKSSIIAKAIEAAENTKRKICYRFIGATPHSSSTKEVLTSIMNQLGINIQNNADGAEIVKNVFSRGRQQETFEEFSYRIYDAINVLKEDLVIFIDAVDQLVNEDQFLWLPSKLPENVKIIISALDDLKYVEDSQYFKVLKNKTNNLIEIPIFSEPIKLLQTILNSENRTLQLNQEAYFLKQFYKVQSPLYVIVAAQELKNWKSYDTDFSLADTQQGIIQEFLENLSTIYHHNGEFVQKILGYIYASRDGLSEDELLQLISTDKEFVKQIAPEHFHTNETGDLPLVIWTRLYTQLKPFLSSKSQDGEELLYFFHREFEDVVRLNRNQQHEHEELIESTQKLIEQYQNEVFDSNRWGKIYIAIVINLIHLAQDDSQVIKLGSFIVNLNNLTDEWIVSYLDEINMKILLNQSMHKYSIAKIYADISTIALVQLSKKKFDLWIFRYILILNKISQILLALKDAHIAKEYISMAVDFSARLFQQLQNDISKKIYAESLQLLSEIHKSLHEIDKAIDTIKKSLELDNNLQGISLLSTYLASDNKYQEALELSIEASKTVKDNDPTVYNNLAQMYLEQNQIVLAKYYQKKAMDIVEERFSLNRSESIGEYVAILDNYASCLYYEGNFQDGLMYELKAYNLLEPLFSLEPDYWCKEMIKICEDLAEFYWKLSDNAKTFEFQNQSFEIMNKYYLKDKKQWILQYSRSIEKFGKFYKSIGQVDKIIELEIEILNELEVLYENDKNYWAEKYTTMMSNLSDSYLMCNQLEKAKIVLDKLLLIQEELYIGDSATWIEDYIIVIGVYGTYYSKLSDNINALKKFDQAYQLAKKMYMEDQMRWENIFFDSSNHLINLYKQMDEIKNAVNVAKDYFDALSKNLEFCTLPLFSSFVRYLYLLRDDKQLNLAKKYVEKFKSKIDHCHNSDADETFNVILIDLNEFIKLLELELIWQKKSIPRNSKCLCGSGRKYKQCCGKNTL